MEKQRRNKTFFFGIALYFVGFVITLKSDAIANENAALAVKIVGIVLMLISAYINVRFLIQFFKAAYAKKG
jgi:ABC-type microcin C transport system permease subunit YejE